MQLTFVYYSYMDEQLVLVNGEASEGIIQNLPDVDQHFSIVEDDQNQARLVWTGERPPVIITTERTDEPVYFSGERPPRR